MVHHNDAAARKRSKVSGAQLTIKYGGRRGGGGRERRVVYLRYGTPPVTTAEVEIMQEHLEAISRQCAEGAGAND